MKEKILDHIKSEYLSEGEALESNTSLITGGIIDSISTLKLVDFLESTFSIEFDASEINAEHLDTVDLIIESIQKKATKQNT